MTALRYRKKPVVIEAFQATLLGMSMPSKWPEWLADAVKPPPAAPGPADPTPAFKADDNVLATINTLEGVHNVDTDDWIIRGVEGELYPCKPGIFAKTYDEAKAPRKTVVFRDGVAQTMDAHRAEIRCDSHPQVLEFFDGGGSVTASWLVEEVRGWFNGEYSKTDQ
ncbi:MAG: hypothetical protein OXC11_13425 [Rhodospirillales bacterium]|nr:hypothetical protein [Rhodospirillales bacterium]